MRQTPDTFQRLVFRVQDSVSHMSPRDRKLMIGLVSLFVLLVVGGGIALMNSNLNRLENRIKDRQVSLVNIQRMAREYQSNLDKSELIEKQLKLHQNTPLTSFIEKSAKKVGIQRDRLDAIRDKNASIDGDLEEKMYSVQLSKLTLEEALSFLHEVETAKYPLQIRSASMKTTKYSGEKVIRLTLDLAGFKLVGATDGGEG
jgi:type II secretory pathway component PulM